MGSKHKDVQWRTQESRSVRPFRSAESYLRDAGLRLYNDEDFGTLESLQVESIEREKLSIA